MNESLPPDETWGLPPTQALVMEVLAARTRLGEPAWTFSSRHGQAVKELETRGLVTWKHWTPPHSLLVHLTDKGRSAVMLGTYKSPLTRLLEEALHLCQHGEYAPGGNENWGDWAAKAERILRGEA